MVDKAMEVVKSLKGKTVFITGTADVQCSFCLWIFKVEVEGLD